MTIETENGLDRIRYHLVRELLNRKEEDLDKPYLHSSQVSFTRRELAKEIENNTEVGKRQVEMMINLTIDLWEREKIGK